MSFTTKTTVCAIAVAGLMAIQTTTASAQNRVGVHPAQFGGWQTTKPVKNTTQGRHKHRHGHKRKHGKKKGIGPVPVTPLPQVAKPGQGLSKHELAKRERAHKQRLAIAKQRKQANDARNRAIHAQKKAAAEARIRAIEAQIRRLREAQRGGIVKQIAARVQAELVGLNRALNAQKRQLAMLAHKAGRSL